MNVYIKKQNGRYEKLGESWDGFPANGWWFVGDGRENLVVPIEEPRPLAKLKYLQYRNAIVRRLVEAKKPDRICLQDLVGLVLSELEELIGEEEHADPPK